MLTQDEIYKMFVSIDIEITKQQVKEVIQIINGGGSSINLKNLAQFENSSEAKQKFRKFIQVLRSSQRNIDVRKHLEKHDLELNFNIDHTNRSGEH
jgi:hypothetical protein